jgi:hypothetical protein
MSIATGELLIIFLSFKIPTKHYFARDPLVKFRACFDLSVKLLSVHPFFLPETIK